MPITLIGEMPTLGAASAAIERYRRAGQEAAHAFATEQSLLRQRSERKGGAGALCPLCRHLGVHQRHRHRAAEVRCGR